MAKKHKGMMMFHKLIAAVASLVLVTGCADASVHVGGRGPGHLVKSTNGSFVGTPGVSVAVSYDTSIGSAVDANGFTTLPLRAGASAYFVNSSTGSDANSCPQAKVSTTPKATASGGVSCITAGTGDQVLVAEGTSYANFPAFAEKPGFSLTYPTALRSYDPADASNTAKYGRASGSNRPVFGPAISSPIIYSPANTDQQNYIAIQGVDINPGSATDFTFAVTNMGDGLLVENSLFQYVSVAVTKFGSITAHHWIFRNDGFHGGFSSTTDQAGGGIYADGTDSITVEDDVFSHNGWKEGALRSDPYTSGGPTQFRHPLYLQATTNGIVRRNLIADGSTMSVIRGHSTVAENLMIDNPGAFSIGDDNNASYSTDHPLGEDLEAAYNAAFGDDDINSTSPLGWGITTTDGRNGDTAIHDNLIVQSRSGTSHLAPAFRTNAYFPIPSYADWHNNVSYLWAAPGSAVQVQESGPDGTNGAGGVGQTRPTYENNKWDATASGSNVQSTSGMFPTAYTAATLYTALGYADKATFIAYALAHPEAHIQRAARALLFTGYGMSTLTTPATLRSLTLSPTTVAAGTPASVVISGATGGSVLSGTSLPTGITVTADHLLAWDGTGSAGTPSFTLTELDPYGQTKSTSLSLTITGAADPILSLPGLVDYFVADPAKLYSDAGATLITDGGAVAQWNNKGTGGNASQATSADRPVYHANSGKPYLQFDGTNDVIATATHTITAGNGTHWVAMVIYPDAVATFMTPVGLQGDPSGDVSRLELVGAVTRAYSSDITNAETFDSAANISASTAYVLIYQVTPTTVELWLDNVSDGSTALTGTRRSNTTPLAMGSQDNGTQPFPGRIMGVLTGSGTLSSGDRTTIQTWGGTLH